MPPTPEFAPALADLPNPITPHVLIRGNPNNQGPEVPRRYLTVLSQGEPKPFVKGSGRLELAEAIASKDNPLTARVFVNRVWLHHFGAGLVRTPSDFGTRAEPPTHPELLDWLARYLMDNSWSVKALHRVIMLSATYQQASGHHTEEAPNVANSKSDFAPSVVKVKLARGQSPSWKRAEEIDPENKLLWHMN